VGTKLEQIDICVTKLKSRQWHLEGTVTHGSILPCGTDNVMCHTKELTRDKKNQKEKFRKKKIINTTPRIWYMAKKNSKTRDWHVACH